MEGRAEDRAGAKGDQAGRGADQAGRGADQKMPGPIETGRIGRYQIKGELGRGAMGVVYLAIDPAIGRPVAIKTIRIRDITNQAQQDKLRDRLFREARSAGGLSHPNIVTIYDMDEDEGVAYIAMAFVNGPTLDRILSGAAAMTGAQMLQILRQSASALDYAHSRGVIHRDVKPGNIMLDEDGSVKIADFGIAKFTAPSNTTETRTVTGTPSYMSPEQVQGLAIDGRSDQFSLAVIAYEILTGERPFHGEHLSTIVYRIVAEEPAESHRINASLTPQIDAVLRRALAKKPESRFPNCSSFTGALEMACAESRGWKPIASGAARALPTVGLEAPKPDAPQKARAQADRRVAAPLSSAGPAPARSPVVSIPEPHFAAGYETPPSRSSAGPVLAGVVVALGLAAVFAWEAGMLPGFASFLQPAEPAPTASPDSSPPPATPDASTNPPQVVAPAPDEKKPDQGQTDQAKPDVASADQPRPDTPKPSPLAPPAGDASAGVVPEPPPAPSRIDTAPPTRAAAKSRAQDVWVTTNPPGAKVVFDDDLAGACASPCMLHGPAGVHHLTYSLAGYQNEYREIRIGETAIDAPLVALRQPRGTLLLTTTPPGASVRVDGKPVPGTTPAQISLAPGPHNVTVELGGRSQTQRVEVQDSPVYLRFTLGQ
jgi:serine/threonine protein kinase